MGQHGVEEFLATTADAWNNGDGKAFAELYTEEGSLINPFGQRADGRAALATMYGEYFGGMLKGSTTSIKVHNVRLVGDDHAMVDAQQVISAPDGTPMLDCHLAALLQREGSSWRFVDARPYVYASPPG